mmetsp:Transcript_14499/g.36672  ORF Transcript_14499/g.36672 Transcript_14499/m.36672 type:complete len:448 (-) Transcript_14499:31-1374(-)
MRLQASSKADMQVDEPTDKPQVWQPGDPIEEGEELEYDRASYQCFHQLALEWPCLSFDILRDNMGAPRTTFPLTQYMVAGTQAPNARGQTMVIAKLDRMGQGRHGDKAQEDEGAEDDEMSDSDGEEDDQPPIMHHRLISHPGSVNRIRAMPQQPSLVATWSERGTVQVYDVAAQLKELDEEGPGGSKGKKTPIYKVQPKETLKGHKTEGYAVDWSPVRAGLMATGDCGNAIRIWEPKDGGGWVTQPNSCNAHEGSVEDIQWSPTEEDVFVSSSVDKHIFVWDKRQSNSPMLKVQAHDADVNVVSWNRSTTYMLASGGDDGVLRIWDLRNFTATDFVAHFKHHQAPVTSVEWCPHEPSMLATTSADNQTIVWDLALERDPEEEAAMAADMEALGSNAVAPTDIPPQLLFVHAGQRNVKEMHWHTQIPGLITATAEDGFHVFKPSNLGM